MAAQLYIGLMSGTSLDGVDAVALDFSQSKPQVAAKESAPIAIDLRADLSALNAPGADELHRAALAANALMRVYAQVVHALLAKLELKPKQIRALGAHGQTVRHRPQQFDGTGYTIQLVNGALLAELTGIDVVCDFRSRDVAAGGQGAPLAPLFHRAWFAQAQRTVGVLNIGGISNLTLLHGEEVLLGFDCGPGNVLMDEWCAQQHGEPFDAGGAWAASGQVIPALLEAMLGEPYFARPAPKSTGRELFNRRWLAAHLDHFPHAAPQNVQASLLELTARSIAYSVLACQPAVQELIVCGGGAYNKALLQRLQALLPQIAVRTSDVYGLAPQEVEAAAFAWLARQCIERVALMLEPITGAQGARVLGAMYPA